MRPGTWLFTGTIWILIGVKPAKAWPGTCQAPVTAALTVKPVAGTLAAAKEPATTQVGVLLVTLQTELVW